MHGFGIALTCIMLLALVLFMAPNVLRLNRGKVLRNIAIWLAIFAVLGFAYKYIGPGDQNVMMPTGFSSSAPEQPPPEASDKKEDKNFTPPKD